MRLDTGRKLALFCQVKTSFAVGPSKLLRDEGGARARLRAFGVAGTSLRSPHDTPGVI